MPVRIVITGAPGSGKSEFLARLKSLPRFRAFAFLDEVARRLLEENPDYRHDKAALHADIYREQAASEAKLDSKSFITDRGTADAFAFHPGTLSALGTTLAQEYSRYDCVVQLGTSASLGHEHYVGDDIRVESVQEALQIEEAIRRVWQGHPAYHFVPATPDIEAKFDLFIQTIDACVDDAQELTE